MTKAGRKGKSGTPMAAVGSKMTASSMIKQDAWPQHMLKIQPLCFLTWQFWRFLFYFFLSCKWCQRPWWTPQQCIMLAWFFKMANTVAQIAIDVWMLPAQGQGYSNFLGWAGDFFGVKAPRKKKSVGQRRPLNIMKLILKPPQNMGETPQSKSMTQSGQITNEVFEYMYRCILFLKDNHKGIIYAL